MVAAQAAAQQLALANQGVNVQAATQNMSMPQQVAIPAAAGGPAQQQVLAAHAAAVAARAQQQYFSPCVVFLWKTTHPLSGNRLDRLY